MRLVLDPRTRWLDDRTLLSPTGRLLRLAVGGPSAIARLARDEGGPSVRRLGATLLDAGAAHPHPPAHEAGDVTVVIPVKDRSRALEVCLAALHGCEVVVVDDGSSEDIAAVCARHGARYVQRDNGGPAAARNTALALLDKEFVAFLDSDCLPPRGWIEQLRGHFEDPGVVAVAPRVVGGPRSPLDLGQHPAKVRPGGAVAYVPTAALIVRRSALQPFDEGLRYGEDVDLIWRLIAAGGTVRYDPSVVVEHTEPEGLARLRRRFHYGTSAAPLAQRHPRNVTHLVLPPLPTAVLGLLLARRPLLATLVGAAGAVQLNGTVNHPRHSARLVVSATAHTGLGVGRALALLGPLAWLAATKDRRAAVLLAAPAVQEWWQRGRPEAPVRFTARVLTDQAAYGAGVVAGCVTHRTLRPLLPTRRI